MSHHFYANVLRYLVAKSAQDYVQDRKFYRANTLLNILNSTCVEHNLILNNEFSIKRFSIKLMIVVIYSL